MKNTLTVLCQRFFNLELSYKENKKVKTMKKRNYRENFFISEKFSVIYISKERANLSHYYIIFNF